MRDRFNAFRRTRFWRWVRWPVAAGVVCLFLLVAGFGYLYATVELPEDPPQLESSVILDADGEQIAVLQKDGLREPVELDEVAPVVVDALIAAEDQRFYEHGGIDPVGIARAFVSNLQGGSMQGGSTITQQLVKNSYLGTDRTLSRKVNEAVLSIKLEQRVDKDEILERYLNTVYFGRGTYGIQAAAEVYFEKDALDLELHEAALLVGLLRAPESADPKRDPEEARRRRRTVLEAMESQGVITEDEATMAGALPLGATALPSPVTLTAGVAPHFVEWVRAEAIDRFGADVVYGGGLHITTTLDLDDQRAAEMAVAGVLTEKDDPQAALVGMDSSGAIRAYVGGRDYDALKVDLARGAGGGGSGRQPGSTFKPFVLAAALEAGIPLGTEYPAPSTISLDTEQGPYEVDNYGGQGFGVLDLTEATTDSVNTVYAQLAQDVGPDKVVDVAHRLGVESELAPNPSLVLGTSEVSVLDMATSYLTLAREGQRVEPWTIARVEDGNGRVVYEAEFPEGEQAVEPGVAQAVTYALEHVISSGTGTAAALDRPVAGKTGTTQGNGDAWFAGYTPDYAAVVWLGYPEGPSHAMTDVHGSSVTGGGLPAQIWQRFMSAALQDVEPSEFTPPPDDLLAVGERPDDDVADLVDAGDDEVEESSTTTSSSTTTTTEAVEDEEDADEPGNGDPGNDDPPGVDDVPGVDEATTTTTTEVVEEEPATTTTTSTTTTTAAPTTTTESTTTTSTPPGQDGEPPPGQSGTP